jgi:hypothetical protein
MSGAMNSFPWVQFWPQCSDALDYLDKGKQCAKDGVCFDTLRPMISNLWFSIPSRMGLPEEILLLMHAMLFLVSVLLASRVLLVLANKINVPTLLHKMLIMFACALVHAFFLTPIIFYALTDAPAGLLVLIAIECIVLMDLQTCQFKRSVYLVSGMLLGAAVGLRVFYLYPVLITVVVYLFVSLLTNRSNSKRYKKLYLCIAFVPVLMQMHATYLYSSDIAYLPQDGTQYWRNAHQRSPYIGYDTLMPEEPYAWHGNKEICAGVWTAVEQRNWRGLQCTLTGRLYFLLGSYAYQTYVQSNRVDWDYMSVDPRLQITSLNQKDWPFERTGGGGARVSFADGNAQLPWKILEEIWLNDATALTFSVTLRDVTASEVAMSKQQPHSLYFWLTEENGQIIDQYEMVLSSDFHRYQWKTAVNKPGRYVAVVGSGGGISAPALFDAGDFTVQTGWHEEPYPMAPERIRWWSSAMLVVQCMALMVALVVILLRCRLNPCASALAILPLLILAQSLLVIPEQRFVAVMEIMLWVCVVACIQYGIQKLTVSSKPLLKSAEN